MRGGAHFLIVLILELVLEFSSRVGSIDGGFSDRNRPLVSCRRSKIEDEFEDEDEYD